jgi:hypothetical protein
MEDRLAGSLMLITMDARMNRLTIDGSRADKPNEAAYAQTWVLSPIVARRLHGDALERRDRRCFRVNQDRSSRRRLEATGP